MKSFIHMEACYPLYKASRQAICKCTTSFYIFFYYFTLGGITHNSSLGLAGVVLFFLTTPFFWSSRKALFSSLCHSGSKIINAMATVDIKYLNGRQHALHFISYTTFSAHTHLPCLCTSDRGDGFDSEHWRGGSEVWGLGETDISHQILSHSSGLNFRRERSLDTWRCPAPVDSCHP